MKVWSHPLASLHRGRLAPAPVDLELIRRLKKSFDRIFSAAERLGDLSFSLLFAKSPNLRSMFPDDLQPVKHRFVRMLNWLVSHMHEPQLLRLALVDLGRRHETYGAKSEDYAVMCQTLVEVLAMISADDWNEELARDWRQTFDLMVHHMLRGYRSKG
jgi:nitric oxide dioxygenase